MAGSPSRGTMLRTLRNIDCDESADVGVAAPCQLFGFIASNVSAGTRYLKLYNTAVAATVGTTTPQITIAIPTLQMVRFNTDKGIDFTVGISPGATTGVADADTGAPGANDVILTLFYK